MIQHTALKATDKLTNLIKSVGIEDWQTLVEFVKNLPYGRNQNRTDLSLVISEKKGSCSSKHALLKKVADMNNVPDIKLMLGIYKMNNQNTPKIGDVLVKNGLDFMPEAHCYLSINGVRTDVTTALSEFKNLENDILQEITIEASQVADFKAQYHQDFLKKWIATNQIHKSFDEIWNIREACITNLSKHVNS